MASPVVSEVLPAELRMTAPPTMPQARSYLFKQQSDLQEYDVNSNNCVKINIPRLQQTYLTKDSYIRFKFNIDLTTNDTGGGTTKAAGCWFDRVGAIGLFDRLEVYDYLGGTLIERITDLPLIMNLLYDIENPLLAANGKYATTQGQLGSGISYLATSAGTPSNSFSPNQVKGSPCGLVIYNQKTTATATQFNGTYEFCIPVTSFLGIFSDKFVPLHNGFTLNLYCNSINNALVSRYAANQGADPRFVTINAAWLTNIEFCAQVLELGEQGEALVRSGNGGNPWIIPSRGFRTFKQQINAGESSFRLDMNLNVVSLRNVRFTMHPLVYFNNLRHPLYGTRIRNFLQRFNFQYGSSYLPELAGIVCRGINNPPSKNGFPTNPQYNKAVASTQGYVELLKTSNNKWSSMEAESAIGFIDYNIDLASNAGAATLFQSLSSNPSQIAPCFRDDLCIPGKFAGGIDLRLNNKALVSGIDTNGLLVCLNGTFDTQYLTNMINAMLVAYAEFDAFVQIIPGVATTVTF